MSDDLPKEKHEHETLNFPEGFLWGAATSGHQVEGNNTNSDWWEWEKEGRLKSESGEITPSSGVAANQYELFEEDFKLAKSLNHNSHRLSIEWARIEPEKGKFDEKEIEHYRQVLKSLKDKNIKVMLTLWHYTLPLWVAKKGGWINPQTVGYFSKYAEKVAKEFGEYVDLWITINEPGVYVWGSYGSGGRPPKQKSLLKEVWATFVLAQAHKRAYKAIHQIRPKSEVGFAKEVFSFDAFHHHSILEGICEWGADIVANHSFYLLTGKNTHDFLGLNYYLNHYISFNGEKARLPSFVDIKLSKKDVSDMGWEIYPEGIFDVIMDFSDYHKPIYITENGIASTNDDRRVRFLLGYLKEIYHAIQMGAPVKGYFHWSLIDNFEWNEGFNPRFGLIEVDYKTQKRTPRPSAYVYRDIIKNNGISHDLLKLLGHGIRVEEVIKV